MFDSIMYWITIPIIALAGLFSGPSPTPPAPPAEVSRLELKVQNLEQEIRAMDLLWYARMDEIQKRPIPKLGGTFDEAPAPVAFYEDSLLAPITASGTAMTLVKGKDKTETNLASSTYSMIIDEGTTDEEWVLADCTATVCTNLTRGISPITGTSSTYKLIKPHRRGASVKITDATFFTTHNMVLGRALLPNLMRYKSSTPACSNADDICDKGYIDGVAIAGAADGSVTVKGIFELAVNAEAASSTTSGHTTAKLIVGTDITAFAFTATSQIPMTGADGKIPAYRIATTSAYTWTGNNEYSGNSNFSGKTASSTFAGTVNFGGQLNGLNFPTSSSTPQSYSWDFNVPSDAAVIPPAYRGGESFEDAGLDFTVGNSGILSIFKTGAVADTEAAIGLDRIASTTPTFNLNPVFTVTASSTPAAANVDVCYAVVGTLGGTTISTTANNYFGFEFRNNSGVSQVFIVNANESAQTRTQVGTEVGSVVNIKNLLTYSAVMYSGNRIEFYANGVKLGAHTTNLPSGDFTSNTTVQFYFDGVSGTGAGRCDFLQPSLSFGR